MRSLSKSFSCSFLKVLYTILYLQILQGCTELVAQDDRCLSDVFCVLKSVFSRVVEYDWSYLIGATTP
jgi:hypothetical protein